MAHLQLSFADLPAPVEDDGGEDIDLGSMERVGATLEFGYLLLQLMTADGWTVIVTKPFAGIDLEGKRARVLVIAERGPYELRRVGVSVAAIAPDLFEEAARIPRPRRPRALVAAAS